MPKIVYMKYMSGISVLKKYKNRHVNEINDLTVPV
jgi:hypothetical protein